MSRVMNVHETILHHGVSEEAFERFLREIDLPNSDFDYS
jgi:hypothetical protein